MPAPGAGGQNFFGERLDVDTANVGTLNAANIAIAGNSLGASRNASVPAGGFPAWSAALAKAAAGTGIATVWGFGASIINGGTATTDIMTKPYFALWRAAKRAAGYTTHGDSFLPSSSSNFNPNVTASVFPWATDVNPAIWGFYGPFTAPGWVTQTTMPLIHATHPSAALGYNARSCRLFYWDGGNQDGGTNTAGRTWHARVNADGATDQTVTNLGDNLIHSIDFTNMPNQVGNVINIGNQGAASSSVVPICISWYPTTTVPTTGIHYAWFSQPGNCTMFDLARTDGTVTQYRIERFIGPSGSAVPFTANAALSPPFAPDLVFFDVLDDIAFVNTPTSSGSTPAFTVSGGPSDMYHFGWDRCVRAWRQKTTGCDIVHHMPNFATGLVSDTAPGATYQLQNAWRFYGMTKPLAEINLHGWLNTDAEWRETGLAQGFFVALNPHPTDLGHLDIFNRITTRLGL